MPNITYTIVHSRRRTVSFIVNRNGELVVRAPHRVSNAEIERMVQEKSAWILRALEKTSKQRRVKKEFIDGELFWYLGEQLPLRVSTPYHRNKVETSAESLDLFVTLPKPSEARIKKLFEDFYKKQAKLVLEQRAVELAKVMGLRFNRISIRSSTTRWGSCSSLGNINFSWRLVMAPPTIIDYVVIHELSHLAHKNHSQKFWDLVGSYYPNHKNARKWLNTNGHKLVI